MRWGFCGVIDVDVMIAREGWIESDSVQASFIRVIRIHGKERRGQEFSAFDDAKLAVFFADEQAAVRREFHRGWIHARGQLCFDKPRRQSGSPWIGYFCG